MRAIRFGVLVGMMAAVLACGTAFAQGGRPGGGAGFGQLTLSRVPVVVLEKELKLTADQKDKITAIQTKSREDMRALFQQAGQGGDRQAMMQKMQEMNTKVNKDIEDVLTAEQKAKLPELLKKWQALQTAGIPLEVYGDLKLTEEQTAKILKLAEDYQAKMRQAMQNGGGGNNQQAFQQMRTQRDEMRTQVQAALTDEQKAIITKWNADNPQRGGRGGQGGRRGGGGGGNNG